MRPIGRQVASAAFGHCVSYSLQDDHSCPAAHRNLSGVALSMYGNPFTEDV